MFFPYNLVRNLLPENLWMTVWSYMNTYEGMALQLFVRIAMKVSESCKQEKKPGRKYRSESRDTKQGDSTLALGHINVVDVLTFILKTDEGLFSNAYPVDWTSANMTTITHARTTLKWHRNTIMQCIDRPTRCRSTLQALCCEMTDIS